ncbi:MAG: site-2 protease family protein [Eubacteriales bacterium]|nr:site-2 protease family protein [Eubacteriales bacterium]
MFGMSFRDLLIRIFALTLSLSFHEFAHAWTAYRLGDATAAERGRLSLNPMAHLDPLGTMAILLAGIGWAKPVPVNPARFDRKYSVQKGMFLTAVAGPIANLILATISMFIMQTWFFAARVIVLQGGNLVGGPFTAVFTDILTALLNMNIALAFFNLLPLPPLDGSRIFGAILPKKLYFTIMQYERYIGMAFFLILIFGRGLIGTVIYYISYPFRWLITIPLSTFFDWLLKFFY